MSIYSIDQRAIIIGEEGLCPECERPVLWSEIDKNWYICNDCIEAILSVEVAVHDHA